MAIGADQILAFRLARSGLARRNAGSLAEAANAPASDTARDNALQALAARFGRLKRESYDQAVDDGDEIVVAYAIRGTIQALPADDHGMLGRSLIATDDDELGQQLGRRVRKMAADFGFRPTVALDQVTEATKAALAGGASLDKNELHEELRNRVDKKLMPWCEGCGSHHVTPMLWRYATIKAGARLDAKRRYLLSENEVKAENVGAQRRFLSLYGPTDAERFAEWAGLAKAHAGRLWEELDDELVEVDCGDVRGWILADDAKEFESPSPAEGVVLIPAGDPYLQKVNRPLLAPDPDLRKRLFRPVASPGVVLGDGRLVGLWRAKKSGKNLELTVEKLDRVTKTGLEGEAERIAELRGAEDVSIVDP